MTRSVVSRLHLPAEMFGEASSQTTQKPEKPDRALALSGFQLNSNPKPASLLLTVGGNL